VLLCAPAQSLAEMGCWVHDFQTCEMNMLYETTNHNLWSSFDGVEFSKHEHSGLPDASAWQNVVLGITHLVYLSCGGAGALALHLLWLNVLF